MNRTLILSLVVYGLILAGLGTLQREVLVLAIPLVLYLGAGFLYAPQDLKLKIVRTLSADRVAHNQSVRVQLVITNEGPELEMLHVEDIIPRGLTVSDGEATLLTPLPAGESVEFGYTLVGQRGYYQFPGALAEAKDSFGLFRRRLMFQVFSHLYILPEVVKLPNIAIQPRRTRVFPGTIRARKGGPGVEFFGVREYQPGDSLRWLNSRASARQTQTLYVNEFEQERAIDVGLIMDARQKTNLKIGEASLFEHTVQATTTLADTFLSQGHRVSLFIYGGYLDWTFPGSGKLQRERILRALARADLQDSLVFQRLDHLPTRLFPARSQLVFISPLREEDIDELIKVRAHGYPLMVVSPDPVAFETQTLGAGQDSLEGRYVELGSRLARLERRRMLHRLGQLGVRLFEWQVDTPFHEAAHVALNRPVISFHEPGG